MCFKSCDSLNHLNKSHDKVDHVTKVQVDCLLRCDVLGPKGSPPNSLKIMSNLNDVRWPLSEMEKFWDVHWAKTIWCESIALVLAWDQDKWGYLDDKREIFRRSFEKLASRVSFPLNLLLIALYRSCLIKNHNKLGYDLPVQACW